MPYILTYCKCNGRVRVNYAIILSEDTTTRVCNYFLSIIVSVEEINNG